MDNKEMLWQLNPDQQKRAIVSRLNRFGEVHQIQTDGRTCDIYFVTMENRLPKTLVAKVLSTKNVNTYIDAKHKIASFINEFEKCVLLWRHHAMHIHRNIEICYDWPIFISPKQDGTLNDLIYNYDLRLTDKIQLIIQLCRALQYCHSNGIICHQDLKPQNIFFRDLRNDFDLPSDYEGMLYHIKLADFGLSNAFSEIGRNSGSRPYMAPEQYSKDLIRGENIDQFAFGVLMHEILTYGYHPIGVRTAEVWPDPISTQSSQWKKEKKWREWSNLAIKNMNFLRRHVECFDYSIISRLLSFSPTSRISLDIVEKKLWRFYDTIDFNHSISFRNQIEAFDRLFVADKQKNLSHLSDCLNQLRRMYSHF